MLNESEFEVWCQQLKISENTRQLIEQIRSSAPSRPVQGGRKNVSGHYPSRKMGLTIQFESHRHELARIYELEHDPDVLEYYDQPPAIELYYETSNGRHNRHRYTPDFFVIRTQEAGWEECKSAPDLEQLSVKQPHRYCKAQGQWQCPPAAAYAQRWNLTFRVWSSQQVNWTLQQNWIWLEDYFSPKTQVVDREVCEQVTELVAANPGIRLSDLLKQLSNVTSDDLHTLIAQEQIYVSLQTAPLSQPQLVQVFSDATLAKAYDHVAVVTTSPVAQTVQILSVTVGAIVIWDGERWEIVNTGSTNTGLLRTDGKFVELPNAALDALIQKGQITIGEGDRDSNPIPPILQTARQQDIEEANRRYEILLPYLNAVSSVPTTRTIRRWRSAYRAAESLYGSGYLGLLPHHTTKGNRIARLDETVVQLMQQFINEQYETIKHRGQLRVYEAFRAACQAHQPALVPPSFHRFWQEIQRRDPHEQTLKREGRRAATAKAPFYWSLELMTPRHGERPFEIVHIDHTQLDIELMSSLMSLSECKWDASQTLQHPLGRPWVTFMADAYSRRLLAVYLTFEEPSYRSCMMALRICVQRFERFPQTIVVDNGKEFHSHYFEQLLAAYVCTKKHRPPATARFGSIVERLFGTANTQFVYELQGNTQLTKNARQLTLCGDNYFWASRQLEQMLKLLQMHSDLISV